MKVRIIKDWDEPNFLRQTPGGRGYWDDILFTDKPGFNCDVLITLNAPNKNVFTFCRPGGRWLMSQEPPHEFYLWQTRSYKYFDRIYTFWDKSQFPDVNIINAQTSLPWHVGKSFDELVQMGYGDLSKTDEISWITSNLNTRPGHSLRLQFLDFLHEQKLPFHLFGRGFKPIDDKFNGIAPFKYSIAIENFACNDYWTEKIADCFLSWTMPIYFGCQNIASYFPKESMILIDPNEPEQALRIIKDAVNGDRWKHSLEYIKEARDLILHKYQFFPAIAEKIKAAGLNKRKRFYLIRRPS
jgi:hypothetical protein